MDAQSLAEPMGQLVERLQSLPLEVHGVVGLAMVAGLLMWAWGWKVLKPMTVVVSALAGSYAASLAAPSLGLAENVRLEAIVLAGFAFGALAGLLVYRSAMALGTGVVVAVAAPLVASVVLEPAALPGEAGALAQDEQYLRGVEVRVEPVADVAAREPAGGDTHRVAAEIRELMRGAAGEAEAPAGPLEVDARGRPLPGSERLPEDPATAAAVSQLKRFVQAVADEAELQWNRLPEQHRFVYGSTAIAGLAVGVMIGLMLPGRAASGVTALFGAAVWLPSFVWLSGAWDMPWRDALGRLDGQGWLIVWSSAAFVGLVLQWRGMRRSRGKEGDEG